MCLFLHTLWENMYMPWHWPHVGPKLGGSVFFPLRFSRSWRSCRCRCILRRTIIDVGVLFFAKTKRTPSHFRPLFHLEIPLKGRSTIIIKSLFYVALSKDRGLSFSSVRSSVHRHKHSPTMDRPTVCLFCLFGRVSYSGCSQFGCVYLQRFVRVRECYK